MLDDTELETVDRPALIAELRDLRVESEKRLDALIKVRAERDALRAKVAAVEALADTYASAVPFGRHQFVAALRTALGGS